MLRSMYSGISGMKANQTRMDVVGNNVANVGTTAYKKTATRFSDSLYQNAIYSSAPGNGIGGVSPGQVGLGTKVSGIFKNMVQGAVQVTGRSSDLAIDGDGFFTVQTGPDQYAYTRDGSFSIDMNGNLVTAEGYMVMGYMDNSTKLQPVKIPTEVKIDDAGNIVVDADGNIVAEGDDLKKVISYNISKEGKVSYLLEDGTKVPQTTDKDGKPLGKVVGEQRIRLAIFQNPEGLQSIGGNLYTESANSGKPVFSDIHGQINQGAIEMSNVDLSEEFTEMIVTTRAFQASSKVITTSDELLQEIVNLKR